MIRPILMAPAPELERRCAPVTGFDAALQALVADLFDTLYEAQGRGLAAPQIGVLSRVFVMDSTWKEGTPCPEVFVNPELIKSAPEQTTQTEQCLSIPDMPLEITRPEWVVMRYRDCSGTLRQERFDGFRGRCVQHERDHLDGILITQGQAV